MTDQDDAPKTLEELTSAGTTVMFALTNAGPIESRPLTIAEIGEDRLSILVDDTAPWLQGMSPGAGAHLTISDVRSNTFVSLTGSASLSKDSSVIDRLWNPAAAAYFDDGKDDPGVAVLHFDASSGTYWTAPSGRIGGLISMVRAAVGGSKDAGEHGEVAV
jgi:general stress protein 26